MKSSVVSRAWLESELLAQGLHPCDITDERLAEFKLPPPDRFSRLLTPEDAKWRNVRWKWLQLMMRCYRGVSCGKIEIGAGDSLRGVAIGLVLREQFGRLTPGERLSKRMDYESVEFELWTRKRLQPHWARLLHDLEHETIVEHKTFAESVAPYAVAAVDFRDIKRLSIVDVDADLHAARIAEVWHRTQVGTAARAELRLRDEKTRLRTKRKGVHKCDDSLRVDLDEQLLHGYYVTLGQATQLSYFDDKGRIRASAERWKSAFDKLDDNAHRRHVDRTRRAKKAQDRKATPASESESTATESRAVLNSTDLGDVLQSKADAPKIDALEANDTIRTVVEGLRAMLPSASRAERAMIEAWLVDPGASLANVANRSGIKERTLRKARESLRARVSKRIQI